MQASKLALALHYLAEFAPHAHVYHAVDGLYVSTRPPAPVVAEQLREVGWVRTYQDAQRASWRMSLL